MGSKVLESAIPDTIFAHQYLGDYCLQVVIDATPADTAKKLEGPEVGIEYHLQFLTGISDTKQLAAMAQTEMSNLYLDRNATQLNLLVAPIKLESLTRIKLKRYKGFDNRRAIFISPYSDITPESIVTTVIPRTLQLLEEDLRTSAVTDWFVTVFL